MAADPQDAALSMAQQRLQAKLPAMDLGTILGIVTSLLGLFKNCTGTTPTPPAVKDLVANRPLRARLYINQALREEGLRPLSPQGRQAAEAVLAVATESSEADIGHFMALAEAG